MMPDKIKARLTKERPSTSITIRMPVDVVESMKEIAPLRVSVMVCAVTKRSICLAWKLA